MNELNKDTNDGSKTIGIVGKNPFLWHDHWHVTDYAKVFECLVLVDEISKEADKVIAKIRELESGSDIFSSNDRVLYVATHMRIEKDWMIHCKKRELRSNVSDICGSKDEITTRVSKIKGLKTPMVVYVAIVDALLEDGSILNGWIHLMSIHHMFRDDESYYNIY
ncbi:hypothetical protein L6452_29871 [Arctium lappa]|uniref:Uncharacterized protein n=1 Tax=Arctium lappa TaxID=4217 RepID=A0ACB8ZHE6_ARCLA|nr:hypothetical protein L6452_29871 [Arctium lappa]